MVTATTPWCLGQMLIVANTDADTGSNDGHLTQTVTRCSWLYCSHTLVCVTSGQRERHSLQVGLRRIYRLYRIQLHALGVHDHASENSKHWRVSAIGIILIVYNTVVCLSVCDAEHCGYKRYILYSESVWTTEQEVPRYRTQFCNILLLQPFPNIHFWRPCPRLLYNKLYSFKLPTSWTIDVGAIWRIN